MYRVYPHRTEFHPLCAFRKASPLRASTNDSREEVPRARGFVPRVASWLTGYHEAMFSADGPELLFWLPRTAPLIGGVIGGALFVFGIDRFLSAEIGVVEPTPLR